MQNAGCQAVFFDFDGVLAESTLIKTDAFRQLYAEHGMEVVERAVAYHKAHEGISRLIKIRHCHRHYLDTVLTDEKVAALGAKFSSIVMNHMIECDWVVGARQFLDSFHARLHLFVVSGTPEDELVKIVNARGMAHYFREIRGSPDTKEVIIRNFLSSYRLAPEHTLFVGDAMTDWNAATACGVPFLGRVPPGADNPFPPGTACLADLAPLGGIVEGATTCGT